MELCEAAAAAEAADGRRCVGVGGGEIARDGAAERTELLSSSIHSGGGELRRRSAAAAALGGEECGVVCGGLAAGESVSIACGAGRAGGGA